MALQKIANIKGPQGDPGPQGERGLAGANGIPTDAAVATNLLSPGTATNLGAQAVARAAVLDAPAGPSSVKRLYEATDGAWGAGVAAVRAGTRDAKILVVGDSTAAGIGGSTEGTFPQIKSWPAWLAALLDDLSLPAANGLAIPKSSSGAMPSDNRWTAPDGAWIQQNLPVGFGNKSTNWHKSTPGAQRLRFNDPRILADRFDVYYAVNTTTSYGTFTATATGGTGVVAVTGSQAARSVKTVTISAAAASTSNFVEILNTGTGGGVYILGIEPWLSTRKVVRIGNAGVSGSNSGDWVKYHDDSPVNAWNGVEAIKAYDADLTIIDLGINDADPTILTPPATFRARVQQLVDAATSVGSSVILKTMIPSDSSRSAHEALLVAELRALGLPLIDMFGHYGVYQAALMDDAVHGNDAMYEQQGRYIHAALMAR